MFRHNLLITYRSFLRNKSSFFINLIGLSTGLACVLLIYLWVSDEMSVDKFHEKDEQLYQVMQNYQFPTEIETWSYTPGPMAKAIVEDFPEVEEAANTSNNKFFRPKGVLTYEGNNYLISGIFASKNFFEVFSYDLIEGLPNQVLAEKNSILISEKTAVKLFGSSKDAVGMMLTWNNQFFDTTFQVSGVFADLPKSSTMQFDVVIDYDWLITADRWAGDWGGGYAETYLVLKKGTDIPLFNKKIAKYLTSKVASWKPTTQFVQQYSEKYLHGLYEEGVQVGGRFEYVRLFSIIGLFILLIACINFINLSTAQASRKMKEIGVKKVIGANQQTLILQFLSESMFMVWISLLIALGLVYFLLPHFNIITGKALLLSPSLELLLAILGVGVLTGLLAGSYPAFYLSKFRPSAVLKGKIRVAFGEIWVRKGLVIGQFLLAVIFIVGVFVVNKQMEYTQSKNLGYKRDNVLTFERPNFDPNPGAFLSELGKIPGVVRSSNMVLGILNGTDSQSGYSWSGKEIERKHMFQAPMIGVNVIETLGMEVVSGRTFSREYKDDESKIILNESAVEMMQLQDPVGTFIDKNLGDSIAKRQIIGVVKDFHYGSIHKKVEPLIFRYRNFGRNILIKIQAGTEKSSIAQIEKAYKKFHPTYPFEFTFLDEDYQQLYEAENRVAVLSKYFAGLAIIISCLGLLGLSIFSTEQKKKEIGIRKVLGASEWKIVHMLTKNFTQTILIGISLAMPISYFAASKWLENFAYNIDLNPWFFLLPGILVLVIAWLTVGIQTFQAAKLRPVRSLRDE